MFFSAFVFVFISYIFSPFDIDGYLIGIYVKEIMEEKKYKKTNIYKKKKPLNGAAK